MVFDGCCLATRVGLKHHVIARHRTGPRLPSRKIAAANDRRGQVDHVIGGCLSSQHRSYVTSQETMSTPQAKRRRLNDAAKTLQKPFKSPFRTPLRPNIGSDPPSSDPPEANASTALPSHIIEKKLPFVARDQSARTPAKASETTSEKAAAPSERATLCSNNTALNSLPRKEPTKQSISREIMQLRNEIQLLTQAQSLAASTTDDDLMVLIDRWRTASRAAAEELFGTTRDRVNRMGGVGAWQQRERESKKRQQQWDQEELQAERDRIQEAKENGEVSDEAYDHLADCSEERGEHEPPAFCNADDDVSYLGASTTKSH